MIRIASIAIPDHLRVNGRFSRYGRLPVFQNKHPGPFSHNKAVPPAVKRKGTLQRLRTQGECIAIRKPRHNERIDPRFRSSGEYGVGIAGTNTAVCLPDRVGRGGAGRYYRQARPFRMIGNRQQPGGHIGNHHRNRIRRYTMCALLNELFGFL